MNNNFGSSQNNNFASQNNNFGSSQNNNFGSQQSNFCSSQNNNFASQNNNFGSSNQNSYFNWKHNKNFGSQNTNFGSQNNVGSQNTNFGSQNTNYSSWSYKKTNRNGIRYSAGILPYSFDQSGKLFFLLGKDNENDWSDFGGKCEFKDRNDPINTATREFYEESLGAILSVQECTSLINEDNKIISNTLNGSPYYMYPIYIDFVNYSDIFVKTSNYLKYQFDNTVTSKLIEKTAIRWVSVDTLLNSIENKNPSTPISLRGVFYRTISKFKENLIYLQR